MQDFSGLKVGDKVIVRSYGLGAGRQVGMVVKTLKKTITVSSGKNYEQAFLHDGRAVGSGYLLPRLEEYTEAVAAEIERENRHARLANYLSSVKWKDFPLERLEAIAAMVRTENERQENES